MNPTNHPQPPNQEPSVERRGATGGEPDGADACDAAPGFRGPLRV